MVRSAFAIAVLAALAWGGWWYLGSSAKETALNAWLDDRAAAGWVAERSDVSVNGFPNRIDATVSDLILADPQSGWAWSAPVFQILQLSYKPNHVIAVWPGTQKVSTPFDTVSITSDTLRGSIVFVPDTALTLDRSRLEIANAAFQGTDWQAKVESANFATERLAADAAPDFAHALGLDAINVAVPELAAWASRGTGVLPDVMERAHFDLVAAFDNPWDRHAVEGQKPVLTALNIRDVDISWGELNLRAKGEVTVDANGFPGGDVSVSAKNWREMLDVATTTGLIRRETAKSIETGLNLLAMLSGNRDDVTVPLSFADGLTKLGPIPLGAAPNLHRR